MLVAILCTLFAGQAWGQIIGTTPLSSVSDGDLVVWGTSPTNLAYLCESNWVKCTTNSSQWIIFTVETTDGGFYLKTGDGKYVYSSASKKVEFSNSNKTVLTIASATSGGKLHENIVYGGASVGYYSYNNTGIRPYTSNFYTPDAHLYLVSFSVTYAANGGTGTMTDSNSPYAAGATVTLLNNAFTAPAGNTFNGWVVTDASDNAVTVSNNQFTMPASDVTVTAQWADAGGTTTYSVTYNANGATSGSVPTDDNSYETGDEVTVKDNTGSLAKTGNAFSGWNTQADGLGTDRAAGSTFNITANTTLYAKWTPYTITEQSNNESYGTVSLEGNVITGHPADGYRYASPAYTVDPANSATVEQNGNEFTVTPTANTTVTINFEAIPTHTAHFSVNGTIDNNNDCTVAEGAAITFPSNPAAISGKSFVGWVTAAIDGTTNSEPSFVTSPKMGNSDVTYYAVFADVTKDGDDTYEKLSSNSFDTNAKYVIGATQASNDDTMWYLSSYSDVDVNVSWGVMTSTPSSVTPIEFTLSGSASSLVAKDGSGNYLEGLTTGKFKMSSTSVSVALDNEGKIKNSSSGSYYLRHNYNSGNGGLRWYSSNTGTLAYFYKVIPGVSYSNYCTSVVITYSVTYDGNGATSGDVPTDATAYSSGATVTVLGNTGNLAKTGYTFGGWNTQDDGQGTNYAANETFSITANTTLYAKWTAKTITGLSCTGTPDKTTYSAGESFDPTGLTVTATYNDASQEDVTASVTWTPNPLTAGTTSVTGTYMEQTVNVSGLTVTAAAGSADNPYTVAQAIENTPSTGTSSDVYIHGYVSAFYGSNDDILDDSYHRYYISDDGTTENQLLVFNGKGLNNEAFSDDGDLRIGDEVVICGGLTTYNKTKEVAADNYIVSRKTIPGISWSAASYEATIGGANSFPTLTNANSVTVTYSSTNTAAATIASDGTITLVADGVTTIKATFAGNDDYLAQEVTYTLTVVDPSAPVDICELISISPTTLTVGDLDDFTLTATFVDGVVENTDYEISWQSSDESILEVAGTTYEAKAAGVVTVTVRVEVLDETVYNNVQKEFTVTVQAPAEYVALVGVTPSGTAYALKNIATGNKLTGEEVDVVNGKVINKKEDAISWVVTENETTATIQDKDGKYLAKGSGNTDLIVSTTASTTWTIDVSNKSWTNTTGSTQRSFIYSTQYNYFGNYATSNASTTNVNGEYSSMPTAYTFADGYTRTVTAGSYGTICLPYDVAAEDFSGVKFYSISGKKMDGTTLEYVTLQEEDELVAGAAYIFKANEEATKLVAAYSGTAESEPIGADVSSTGLTGTYSKQYIPVGKYVLKNGTIYYVDQANYVYSGANKAYIDLTDVPEVGASAVKGICLFGEDFETGIMSVDGSQEFNETYNLAGQRIQKAQRGVNIVNGKKVLY